MKKILLLLVFAIATISLAQAQTTYYVTTAGNDASAGTTWGTAFRTVQKALNVANANDQIWVATGTYYPDEIDATNSNNRDATFQLKNGVALYGGFPAPSIANPNPVFTDRDFVTNETILSGDINQSGNLTGNSYTVVTGSNTNATAVIDGFTITGGNADKSGVTQVDPGRSGGGMYNEGGSPTVTNCTFSDNQAASLGGGMYNSTNSSPTVTNCIFAGNSAAIGGGMRNSASSPTVINCTFTGNSATNGSGGGMLNVNSSPTITNCTFSGNTSTGTGANGGGIANANLNPSAITNPTITNTIIWNNAVSGVTNTASASISNTNNPMQPAPNPVISHSIIANSGGGGNNKDVDPLFVAPLTPGLNAGGNYRLRPTSPAINMGNNAAPGLAGITTDLDLNDRIFFNIVDMGAYEVGCEDFTFTNQVAYVDADAIAGNKDGSDWTNAFTDLQDALTVACNCPGKVTEIWVAEGTYYPDEGFGQTNNARASTFQLCNGVALYGGFSGGEGSLAARPSPLAVSILSGDLMQNDGANFANNADNAYHVVTGSGTNATALLDGFTITAGNANGGFPFDAGGGMFNDNSSPSLTNCIFSGNSAGFGGGMVNRSSSPNLTNCTFSGNTASVVGGGMDNFNNSSPSLTNCTFSGNTANNGGGMYNFQSSPTITNSTFSGNSASILGGGMYNVSLSSPTITNTTFSGNTADNGGGMYNFQSSPTITNSTFSGNSAGGVGGGMFNEGSAPTISNSIIWNNQDNSGTGTAAASISNNNSTPNITYSLVQGITDNSNNNKDGIANAGDANYPQFVTPVAPGTAPTTAGNLRLLPCSPVIDMGNDDAITLTEDLDGNPRKNDADPGGILVDMGAYEYQGSLFTSNVVFVDADAMGNNDGTTWTDAFTSLQDALAVACPCGFDIWVADGTYYPDEAGGMDTGDRNATFQLCNNVAIYGGFKGDDPMGMETMRSERDFVANETILSGDIDKNGLFDNGNAYHVVTGSGTDMTARLDGFSITRGLANGSFPNNSGGGMFINAGSPTVVNNAFFENSADNNGGNGGGLAVINSASDPLVLNCRFFANNAQNGGGIYTSSGSITVVNSTFASNMAFADGGGMYLDGFFDTNNRPELTNNTFFSNRANQGRGGAMFHSNSNAIIANSIFFGNTAMEGPVFFTSFISNPLLVPEISYSLVDVADCAAVNAGDGGTCGAGMIFNGDPLFVDGGGADNSVGTADDDLRLLPGSPAINMGNDAVVPADAKDVDDDGDTTEPTPDLDLNDRIVGTTVDMGAYESPCAAQAGELTNSLTSTTLAICQGTDPGFTFDATGENEDGTNYPYAFLLVDNNDNTIVETTTDGDFDLAALIPGTYTVYGLSYASFNTPDNIAAYLNGKSITDVQNDDAAEDLCLELTGTAAAGNTNVITVNANPTASISPDPAVVCSGDMIVLNGNPMGGDGNYTHAWTGAGAAFLDMTDVVNPTFSHTVVGDYMLTYTVTDGNTCIATADILVKVLDCEITISDPCSCKNNATTLENGQFDETVEVIAPSGQTWTMTNATTGLFASSSAAPPAAPAAINYNFTEVDNNDGTSTYTLMGIHVDAIGYSLTATNGSIERTANNTCYYPNPAITGLDAEYCEDEPAVTLMGTIDRGDGQTAITPQSAIFDIDGNMAMEFDPQALGFGTYTVTYTVDAADEGAAFPGCIQAVSQMVQVDPQVVINALSPQTICSTKKQPLSELFNGIIYNGGIPGDLTFEWIIKETDGDNGSLSDLDNTNANTGTYTPGEAAIERGFVTLVLTVDNDDDACEAVVAEVIITILKVDCGTFPWKGND